ncbi:MAG TPA: DUF4390 domain-containing protein [Spirochaetota bacterium]|nr:DUF4390 domain-containing protein [Spirochaetota bacterium]
MKTAEKHHNITHDSIPAVIPRHGLHRRLIISSMFLFFFAISTTPLFSAEITINRLRFDEGILHIDFLVSNYQKKEIIDAVRRGIEVHVKYRIEIVKKSRIGFLFRDVALHNTLRRSVKYDFWNKSFIVNNGSKLVSCYNEDTMLSNLFVVENSELRNAERFKNDNYYIRIRAVLKSIELYFPMNYIFKYFVGFWDFDTGWTRSSTLDRAQ